MLHRIRQIAKRDFEFARHESDPRAAGGPVLMCGTPESVRSATAAAIAVSAPSCMPVFAAGATGEARRVARPAHLDLDEMVAMESTGAYWLPVYVGDNLRLPVGDRHD